MVKKRQVFTRIFCFFVTFSVFHCALASDVSSTITVPPNFLTHSATVMNHFHEEVRAMLSPNISALFSRFSSANILIAEEAAACTMYISGKSPIMSTAEKETMQALLKSPIFDIFDVILPPETSVFVRNSLLVYSIYCSLVSYTNNLSDLKKPFQKGLIASIDIAIQQIISMCKPTSELEKFAKILEPLSREVSSSKEPIGKLFTEIQAAKDQEAIAKNQRDIKLAAIQQARREGKFVEGELTIDFQRAGEGFTRAMDKVRSVKVNLDKFRIELHQKIDTPLKEIFSELFKMANEANRIYFEGMERYYNKLREVSPAVSESGLFGLNILSRSGPDIQIAYIVAPNKTTEQNLRELAIEDPSPITTADLFVQQWKLASKSESAFWKNQPMYGVVKMSHSEPMYIFRSLLNPSIMRPFFFTQRDMCETCRFVISLYGKIFRTPLVVISEQACTGQTGSLSKVDYIYADGIFTKEETDVEMVIPNVCQIRIPTLSGSTTKNISTRFYDPKTFTIEAMD